MQTHQTAIPTIIWHPLHSASAAWQDAVRVLREWRGTVSHERAVARLPAHLRHDIGEIDCRPPPPAPLAETLRAHQQTLESIWLRQF